MRRFIRGALAGVLVVSFASNSFAVDLGRTAGGGNVSPSGAATYTIPIWTPPGPNGITPSISVNYNSLAGNGLAGVGWNLSATSSITRCNRSKAQDGLVSGVTLSMSDRYCIGGNRLRLVSGTYGVAGSVYYTEIADYSRITAYGSAGSGPQYFIVEAKNGLKYEYGNTSNSRVMMDFTVMSWMLNKVYDRNDPNYANTNNYVISYNNANGVAVPDVISWTPNSLGAGTYRYEAKFNYLTTRTDKDSYLGKVAGYNVIDRNRLESIQIKSSTAVVRKYRFTYDTSAVTSRSRLISAKECADDAETNCLFPISFTYQTGLAGVTAGAGSPPAGSSAAIQSRYDLNGDGKDDILYVNAGTCYAAFGTNTGFSSPVTTGKTSCGSVDRFLPNGRDAMLYVGSPVQVVYWNDATSAFVSANMSFNHTGSSLFADHDGDGLADIAYVSGLSIVTRRNTSTGSGVPSFSATTQSSASLSGIPGAGWGTVWSAFPSGLARSDFNGDGAQDLSGLYAVPNGGGSTIYFVRLYGYSGGFTLEQTTDTTGIPVNFPALHFNGDRCTDVMVGNNIQISPCNGAAAGTVAMPATPLQMLDWDGDAKTDLLVNSGGNFAVYLSTGAGFSGAISTSISSSGTYFAADVDGDHQEDLLKLNGASPLSYWTHTASGQVPTPFATNIPDLLANATDGFGVSFSPGYVSTAWGSYNKGATTNFPLQEADSRIVVAQQTSSNGLNGTYNKTYFYVGNRVNSEREESAGFQRIDETDSRNGLITRTYVEQTFPIAGMVSQRELMQPNGTSTIKRDVYTNTFATLDAAANNQRYFTYPSASTSTEYEVGGPLNTNLVRTVTAINLYDNASGALYDQSVTTTEPVSGANGVAAGGTWTTRNYQPLANLLNDTTNWCLGRPGQVQQINSTTVPSSSSITRTTNITWDATACRPTQTVAEPGSGTLQVTTAIGYDGFGNVNSTSVTGTGMTARTSSALYSNATYTTGQFPLSTTNALSHTAYTTWDYNLAVPLNATDPNGLITTWYYDAYGRRIQENNPDGTYTTWGLTYCAPGAGCDPYARLVVAKESKTSAGTAFDLYYAYTDMFDRPILELHRDAGSTYNTIYRSFDSLGRVTGESLPYKAALGSPLYVYTTFDLLNRPITISRPVSDASPTPTQTTTLSYEALTTKVTDAQGKNNWKTLHAVGRLGRSQDHDIYYQNFAYDPFGNPVSVTDVSGNTLQSSTYNLRGMLTQRVDMDMGTWNFTPNALGETVSQTDAKSQTTTFAFDLLGRLTSRTEAEGTSTFVWGNSAVQKDIGQLYYMTGPGYSETYAYDILGRRSLTWIQADGSSFQTHYTYNGFSALDTIAYPTSTSGFRLRLKYGYTMGRPTSIRECTDVNCTTFGTTYWTGNSYNSRDQLTSETLGNGLTSTRVIDKASGLLKSIQTGTGGGSGVQNLAYEWDLMGNLKKRKDLNQGTLNEEFFYDNLYRLDYSQLNGVTNLDLAYNSLGNITNKSDVGNYTYHGTKKHQVISTGSPTNWSFVYDNNGNMTSGRGATTTWTSYNYAASITSGTNTASFSYTPDRRYWKQVSNYTSGGGGTTIYVGGILEKVTVGANTDYRHMIRAGNSTIIVSRMSTGTNSVNYVTSDHLGSSSAITNSSGGGLVSSSFDAFGKRRGSNWTGSPSSGDWAAIAGTTRRGYTDHSMLDNLALIHMNGRVQDPGLGRFASADPFITDPGNTQNYNRYSYVYNNPLKHVDPSGFDTICVEVPYGPSGHESETQIKNSSGQWETVASGSTDRRLTNLCYSVPNGGETGGGGGGGDEVLEEVVVTGVKQKPKSECTPVDLASDIWNKLKQKYLFKNVVEIDVSLEVVWGWNDYDRMAVNLGVNSLGQVVGTLEDAKNMEGDGAIAAGSLGVNLGLSDAPAVSGAYVAHHQEFVAALGHRGGSASVTTSPGSGSGSLPPPSGDFGGRGRFAGGRGFFRSIGLGLAWFDGPQTEYVAASDPLFDPPKFSGKCP